MITNEMYEVTLATSVLVNFLVIDRVDLLGNHPLYRFYVTAHGDLEVTDTGQTDAFIAAVDGGVVSRLPASASHAELSTFATLTVTLSVDESAAIAAAAHRSMRIAVDDRAAIRLAESRVGRANVLTTVDIFVSVIHAGLLSVADADAIKTDWAANHRFPLPEFQSFGQLVRVPA